MGPWGVEPNQRPAWPGAGNPVAGGSGGASPAGPLAAGDPAGIAPAGAGSSEAGGGVGATFLQELARALERLEGVAGQADAMAQRLVTGQVEDLSQVMVASEKARLAIELAVQLRNKALEAYQEIMRMPV
ncbi:MAG TPA: flagellar hook-basal body complex protein FliE [Thermaerobacter sp.]